MQVHQQIHGYASGHRFLSGSIRLPSKDQDVIDRLSDLSGSLGPGEVPPPYLTAYPLEAASMYALARTWYDEEAPRSGCVLTHTLLIRLEDWVGIRSPFALLKLLSKPQHLVDKNKLEPFFVDSDQTMAPLPAATGGALTEIAEAFFLEARTPVVVFGDLDAETIALRLAQVIWPAFRREFTFCTFALQPRRIEQREFDLMFAPVAARSRFANSKSRKISSVESKEGRHPWAAQLSSAIFSHPVPRLPESESPFVSADKDFDNRDVRLSLRWNDLLAASSRSPDAVLGMLDLLMAAGLSPVEANRRGEPLVLNALTYPVTEAEAPHRLDFIKVLVLKISKARPSKTVLDTIRQAARKLTGLAPVSALTVMGSMQTGTLATRAFERGVADAIEAMAANRQRELFASTSMRVKIGLLARSRSLCLRLLERDDSAELASLAMAVSEAPETLRRSLRLRVLTCGRPFNTHLAQALAAGVHPASILAVVRQASHLLRNFPRSATAATIIQGLAQSDVSETTAAILELIEKPAAITLIGHIPKLAPRWVMEFPLFEPNDRQQLLLVIIDEADDRQLSDIATSDGIDVAMVEATIADGQVARIRRLLEALTPRIGTPFLAALRALRGDPALASMSSWLPTLAPELPSESAIFAEILIGGEALRSRDLARRCFNSLFPHPPSSIPPKQQACVLELLASDEVTEKSKVLDRIDLLAEQLVIPYGMRLPANGYDAWARMIQLARQRHSMTALRAAAITLHFCFEQKHLPLSKLVSVCFPIVYRSLDTSSPVEEVESFFRFYDWDRQKTLRAKIIDTFKHSDWLAGDFLIAIDEAGTLPQIVRTLQDNKKGRSFLQRGRRELASASRSNRDAARTLAHLDRSLY